MQPTHEQITQLQYRLKELVNGWTHEPPPDSEYDPIHDELERKAHEEYLQDLREEVTTPKDSEGFYL